MLNAIYKRAISAATPEQRVRESWLGTGAERNASTLLQVDLVTVDCRCLYARVYAWEVYFTVTDSRKAYICSHIFCQQEVDVAGSNGLVSTFQSSILI